MKKKMLILKGAGSSGKSTSIKLTFDVFLRWTIKKKKITTVHFMYLTEREVGAVIKFGKESIGISSRGDSEVHVKDGLAFFAIHQCSVVLCATRSRGNPLEAAKSFSEKRLGGSAVEIAKIKNLRPESQKMENIATSKYLFKWLKTMCR